MGNNKYYPTNCPTCKKPKMSRSDVLKRNQRCLSCSNKSHGLSHTKLYSIWNHIKERCDGRGGELSIKYYKNKNIKVCEDWKDINKFISWAENNGFKEGLEIDRIDNNKGYSPENCRFVTRKAQMRNTSRTKKIKRSDGIIFQSLADASESIKKPHQYIQYAIKNNTLINGHSFIILNEGETQWC